MNNNHHNSQTLELEPVKKPIINSKKTNEVFNWLLSPIPANEFINEIWEQKPCIVARENENYYSDLFKGSDLDMILEFARFGPTEMRVVRKGQQMPVKEYMKANGRLDIGRVSQYYLEGHSIVVHSLENFNASIAGFTQALRKFFSGNVLINSYLTPSGAQALKPHYDSHDVLIMQIEGVKIWRLYHSAASCPLNGTVQPDFTRDQLPEPEIITLKKGDVMYIPRGWVHDAESSNESSLHLTVGIHPVQWIDFMSKALAALSLTHEPLRRSLPLGFLEDPGSINKLQWELENIVAAIKEKGLAQHAFSIVQHEFIQNENSIPTGFLINTLDHISELELNSIVTKRANAYSRIIQTNDSVSLQFNNSTLQAPPEYAGALSYISNAADAFPVSDIPGLPEETKIILAQRLIRDGLLLFDFVNL